MILPGPPSSLTCGDKVVSQSLPDGCYAQDANHNFINVDGSKAAVDPKTGKVHKNVRPMSEGMATAQGCPDAVFTFNGKDLARYIFTPLQKLLTRPMSIVNADGEVFISVDTPVEYYNFSSDPVGI